MKERENKKKDKRQKKMKEGTEQDVHPLRISSPLILMHGGLQQRQL